ncbi:hypothetical protein DFH27DRAFT_628706 [Peziza echinospora]|nr:hypothetical protein DFH27DRAFT_628706 [Peziza echinospora]
MATSAATSSASLLGLLVKLASASLLGLLVKLASASLLGLLVKLASASLLGLLVKLASASLLGLLVKLASASLLGLLVKLASASLLGLLVKLASASLLGLLVKLASASLLGLLVACRSFLALLYPEEMDESQNSNPKTKAAATMKHDVTFYVLRGTPISALREALRECRCEFQESDSLPSLVRTLNAHIKDCSYNDNRLHYVYIMPLLRPFWHDYIQGGFRVSRWKETSIGDLVFHGEATAEDEESAISPTARKQVRTTKAKEESNDLKLVMQHIFKEQSAAHKAYDDELETLKQDVKNLKAAIPRQQAKTLKLETDVTTLKRKIEDIADNGAGASTRELDALDAQQRR